MRDRSTGRGYLALLLNLLVFPGVGGLFLRSKQTGWIQIALAAACVVAVVFGGTAILALLALLLVWIWSLESAVREIRRSA